MVFVNPVFISMVIGLILFVTQPTLPSVVTGTIGYIQTPILLLAMIILGFYLSKVRLCAICLRVQGCTLSLPCVCLSFRR